MLSNLKVKLFNVLKAFIIYNEYRRSYSSYVFFCSIDLIKQKTTINVKSIKVSSLIVFNYVLLIYWNFTNHHK
jgi:hypothetical protein